uniref:Uncharacterized protein n=1 Tax=Anguilla anguilla TaxID=7936 RepID=A0A0E9XB58_ANGAN
MTGFDSSQYLDRDITSLIDSSHFRVLLLF